MTDALTFGERVKIVRMTDEEIHAFYSEMIASVQEPRRPCRYTLSGYVVSHRQLEFKVEGGDELPPRYILFAGTRFFQVVPRWNYAPFQLVPPQDKLSWLERFGLFPDDDSLPHIAVVQLPETEVVVVFRILYVPHASLFT